MMLRQNIAWSARPLAVIVIAWAFIVRAGGFITDHSEREIRLNYGMKMILWCKAKGSPLPAMTWHYRSKQLYNDSGITIVMTNLTTTEVKSTLIIDSVVANSTKKSLSYSCKATNINGSVDSFKFKVNVDDRPMAPVHGESVVINSTCILVTWKAVEKVKSPVVAYILYYNPKEERQTSAVNITAMSDATNYTFYLNGLEQLTTYYIYVKAVNKFGEGEASTPEIEETLPLDPEPPQISLYSGGTSVSHQKITLEFVPSPLNKRDILAYQIFVENIQNKPASSPLRLPAVYGNHSLNKTQNQIYIAANFKDMLPDKFILGDENWYGFHYNTRLKPFTKYRIYVRALAKSYINKEKIVFGKPKTLMVSTSFPEIPKIILKVASADSLEISWNTVDSDLIYYKLLVKQEETTIFDQRIKKIPHKLQGLEAGKSYMAYLTVCTEDKCISSPEPTELKTADISESPREGSSINLLIIIVAIGAVVVLVILVLAVVYFVRRRKNHRQGFLKKSKTNGETTHNKRGSKDCLEEEKVGLMEDKFAMQSIEPDLKPLRAKPIIANGESSTDAKSDWESSEDNVSIIKNLQNDRFGKMCKASVKKLRDFDTGSVMVKILKDDPSESMRAEFLSIIETMKRLPFHKGVINLLGFITKEDPMMIIMEYVAYGDLLGFLRTSRGLQDDHYQSEKSPISDLSSAELMSFAEQIASAMAHLEHHKVIHGDLAARNIMIDCQGVCKVTRFGGNPMVFDKDTYATKEKGRLLIKWAAIEVVFEKIRTIQSDVWSYGVLLYEISTVGGCPYLGKDANTLLDMLKDDYRLPCPEHLSEALYSVMSDCWKNDPNERPTFEKLVKVMRTLALMNKHQDHINMGKYDGQLFSKLDDL